MRKKRGPGNPRPNQYPVIMYARVKRSTAQQVKRAARRKQVTIGEIVRELCEDFAWQL